MPKRTLSDLSTFLLSLKISPALVFLILRIGLSESKKKGAA
jgi:hypothetical protein